LIFEDGITKGRCFGAYFSDLACLKRTPAEVNGAAAEKYQCVSHAASDVSTR
jgi:hypothetical protein